MPPKIYTKDIWLEANNAIKGRKLGHKKMFEEQRAVKDIIIWNKDNGYTKAKE